MTEEERKDFQPEPSLPEESVPKPEEVVKPEEELHAAHETQPAHHGHKKRFDLGKTKFSISIIVIAAVFFAAGFLVAAPKCTGSMCAVTGMSSQDAAEYAIDYINGNLLQPGVTASLINATEENGVYVFDMNFTSDTGEMVYTSYVTKDGKLLFTSALDISEQPEAEPEAAPENQEPVQQETGAPKSDRPQADIFVMSYCPYGLQMQKAAIPVMRLLGDKADIFIRFVYYAMHGQAEVDENTRQYCIQKEQSGKFADYLDCFTQTDNTTACRASAGVDELMLASCIAAADEEFSITANFEDTASWLSGRFPLYSVDKALNEMYGVGGSPTFILNGQEVSVSRSPESVKQAICGAFNTAPEECSTVLSTAATSPGIGGGTGTSGTAGCGA